ncbi:glycosyltransferase [uncultured Arthrobacter sp.]|uniref:glycosyltransferase n=1 Tax=uncultured Arthrobacter sp. TaxID=114050 RepID=UPI0025F8752E|nr:glycosyltransferase [uncultured Arthrobacter sp.]
MLPRGAKVLWVSSAGGHLSELLKIDGTVQASEDSLWVTFETQQTVSMLSARRSQFVGYVAPRDAAATLRAARRILSILRRESFDACISTGAAVAVSGLPLAALFGIPTYYVESLARVSAPSFTGRILERAPRVRTYAQYEGWSSRRWPYAGTIWDSFSCSSGTEPVRVRKILVTLGTIRPYAFDRAVDAVLSILQPGDELTWQLGSTRRSGLPGTVHQEMGFGELGRCAAAADVVITHAGVGTILQLMSLGKMPVLAVRDPAHREHVDGHQDEIASAAAARGVVRVLDLARPHRGVLEAAASRRIIST